MLGRHTLLLNPPLINGIAFTRQGRCQEREDVLGTTKPPYTLAVMASRLREAGCDVRLIDATAQRLSTDDIIARLDGEGFAPSLILFPSTTPTLDADSAEVSRLKQRYGAPIFCFGPHASTAPELSMARVPEVDGMFVGEPEDGALQLARLESIGGMTGIASLTCRPSGPEGPVVPHRSHGSYAEFLTMPYPAWDLVSLEGTTRCRS